VQFAIRIPVKLLCVSLSLLFITSAYAQDASPSQKRMTNQDVIEMVKLGLSDDVIVAKIRGPVQEVPRPCSGPNTLVCAPTKSLWQAT
jgi:hypothetical protein